MSASTSTERQNHERQNYERHSRRYPAVKLTSL
jgi:hypothetical protein